MYNHPIVTEDLDRIVDTDPPLTWTALRDTTVLLTGVNGMIATYLVLTLLRLNDRLGLNLTVVASARDLDRARWRYRELADRPDLTLISQNLAEPIRLSQAVDLIVHAASQTSPSQFRTDPIGTIDSNVLATRNLLDWSRANGVRQFLFLSTREIYGENSSGREFVAEQTYGPIDPTVIRSCYPESKRLGETYCMAYRHQHGLDCRIARIAHTYGPGMVIGDGRVMGDFLRRTVDGQNIEMISDGSGRLALTYISDVISGMFRLILDTDLAVANISQDERVVTVRQLAEILTALNPNRAARAVFAEASQEVRSGYLAKPPAFLDSGLIKAAGWRPRVELNEGLTRVLAYFRRNGSAA